MTTKSNKAVITAEESANGDLTISVKMKGAKEKIFQGLLKDKNIDTALFDIPTLTEEEVETKYRKMIYILEVNPLPDSVGKFAEEVPNNFRYFTVKPVRVNSLAEIDGMHVINGGEFEVPIEESNGRPYRRASEFIFESADDAEYVASLLTGIEADKIELIDAWVAKAKTFYKKQQKFDRF
jgi:hypothetical protein